MVYMRKILIVFALVTSLLMVCSILFDNVTADCYASINRNRIAIGDVRPGDAISKVISLHGEPSESNSNSIWYDGEGVQIEVDWHNDYVICIRTQSLLWKTADGVCTGQYADVLNKVYGPAGMVNRKNGYTIYHYYSGDGGELNFYVLENSGKIRIIEAGAM